VATVISASSTRATLQTNYNGLLTQINQLASDASYNGVNLLNSNNLVVDFNQSGSSSLTIVGVCLWLWSMYMYIPGNYPTRMRSLGTGWTDGIGHLGAWGGVLIAGQLFMVTAPRNFILFITIPCALLPAVLLAIFGKNQRRRALA